MKSTIFIPKTIKVGFQNRNDTYTKKLAYVIYYDQHKKLRKETSWQNWRDKNIPELDFPNEPTSGFVLNKKVGDYSGYYGEHRMAYCRIYDKRNFEFEITIENLLYILENTSSIKGKGLEGQFVYGWDKDKLILIPIDSPDYKELTQYNEILHSKNYIKAKDLIIGATYKTKNNDEWVYMGRFDKWEEKYNYEEDVYGRRSYTKYTKQNTNKGKYYWFIRKDKINEINEDNRYLWFEHLKNLGDKFISIISSDCIENYADIFDKLEHNSNYSPIDETKSKYIPYTLEEFINRINALTWRYHSNFYDINKNKYELNFSSETKNCYYYTDKLIWTPNYGRNYEKIELTYEEMFNKIKPVHKKLYLQNGKYYREEY